MKFINLTNDFIEFLDNKSFYFNNDKLKLYNEKKEKKDKIFSSENTNKDLDKVLYKLYNDFEEASNYLLKKKENDEKIYDINIKNINHVHDIPKCVLSNSTDCLIGYMCQKWNAIVEHTYLNK